MPKTHPTAEPSSPARRDTRRRVEQLAKNPLCRANLLSAVHDVPMNEVAKHLGLPSKFGQSRFAIARGFAFERMLFRDGAKVLREHLVKAGVLPADATGFADLRLRMNGGPVHRLDEARERTLALLERVGREGAFEAMPSIVAGPGLEVPGRALLPDGVVALDVLALRREGERVVARVGEVKVYPDRGGHTDPTQLATARAQAGLYLHLLRRVVQEQGAGGRLRVADDGFLVLSRAGRNQPSVRAGEDLRWQARRAEVAVERLREAASGTVGDGARRLRVVRELPVSTRLPHDTVELVRCFYDFRFDSWTEPGERRLIVSPSGAERGVDAAIDRLRGGTVAALTLPTPEPGPPEEDGELVATVARTVRRLLERGARACTEHGERPLTAADIGVTATHRLTNARLTEALGGLAAEVRVDTPERWQGLEREVMIAVHPLSGVTEPSPFDLSTGRLCVMTSRHSVGLILVTRDHVGATLARHVPAADQPVGRPDATGRGHARHRAVWRWLEDGDRLVRA